MPDFAAIPLALHVFAHFLGYVPLFFPMGTFLRTLGAIPILAHCLVALPSLRPLAPLGLHAFSCLGMFTIILDANISMPPSCFIHFSFVNVSSLVVGCDGIWYLLSCYLLTTHGCCFFLAYFCHILLKETGANKRTWLETCCIC